MEDYFPTFDGKFWHHRRKRHKVRLVLQTIVNNAFKINVMSVQIFANQNIAGALGLQDAVTNTPVTGTFANTAASSDNTSSFTASVNPNGTVKVTGVAAGTGNLSIATDASFTDSTNQAQTQHLSLSVAVTIEAVVVADSVVLAIQFGAAQLN